MTEPTKADPSFTPESDYGDPPLEGARSYRLVKPINLAQLDAEIAAATETEQLDVVLTGPDDPSQLIAVDNPALLWLRPGNLDQAVVAATIEAHQSDPQWGVPQVMKAFDAVWAKLQDDPEAKLTPTEVRTLAVGTAFKFNAAAQVASGALVTPQ
jgi:hypothetical protein